MMVGLAGRALHALLKRPNAGRFKTFLGSDAVLESTIRRLNRRRQPGPNRVPPGPDRFNDLTPWLS